jgi:hypothetical protein
MSNSYIHKNKFICEVIIIRFLFHTYYLIYLTFDVLNLFMFNLFWNSID